MTAQANEEQQTLREWRHDAGLTQRELAELVGCTPEMIVQIEKGYTGTDNGTTRKAAEVLGIHRSQILPTTPAILQQIDKSAWEDGRTPAAPKQSLRWWRERRSLTPRELSILAGVDPGKVKRIEARKVQKVMPETRRKLAAALFVSPDKLILPGDKEKTTEEEYAETILRAELRGARRALRRSYDFLRDDSNISLRNLDKRDALLPELERELKGT